MMEDKEKDAFKSWIIGQSSLYEDNLAEDDTLTSEEKKAAMNAVSSFTESLVNEVDQLALYVIACNEDNDGAVYGIYEDVLRVETEELDFLKRIKEEGFPILTVHSVLLEQRY